MPGASGCPLSLSASAGGCASARPSTRSISARGRPPGRSSIGCVEAADDGGFDADRDRPAIDDQVDPPRKVALDMRGRGRRDVAGEIGRRRHHGAAEGAQDVARHRVGRNRGSRRCRGRRWRDRPPRSRRVFGSTSVSGPGQNASASAVAAASKRAILPRGGEIADMGDQRIEGRPALGLVEVGDRGRIGGIGAEAIDGLGRERDQPALGQHARRSRHGGLAGGQNLGFQARLSLGLISLIRLLAVAETQGYKPRS